MCSKPVTPLLTVDGVVVDGGRVLLVKRLNPPFQGLWALPGGFVDVGESCEEAVVREVREETGLDVEIKKLVGVYSDPARDPRGHTASAVYLCGKKGGRLAADDDAADARFFSFDELPNLAFDHALIVGDAKGLLD
ncbi:MAG: NUDIX hydrolase [Candidatus Altiarchaeota archaeon]